MHVLPRISQLIYGGDYNPEQWPRSVWKEDARLMREAGVNLVSVGIFSWAQIQPAPERWEFGWLDEVMDTLHSHGVAVNLATATASPPPWLSRLHPEMLPVTASGAVLGLGGRQHYAPWSQVYRRYARALVSRIASRYARHPALASWHLNNELACHVRESFDAETVSLWREWLQRRYRGIEAVNEAWNTAFWSQRYDCFEEISAPRLAPTILNPSMTLDWRRFCSEAFLDLVRMEKAIVREATPDVPVSTNFVGWHNTPWINHREIAFEIDYVSWDSYPDPAEGLRAAQSNALCHDFMRSLKPGQPFVLMEQAPAAVNWRRFNQPRTPGATRAFSHQALARGADGVMFFQWRQSDQGGEQFHSGMVPITGLEIGGHEHRTWAIVKQIGRDVAAARTVAGSTIKADVALLVDYESIWASEHESKPVRLDVLRETARLHLPLWRRNVPVDVRHPDDDLTNYRVLLAPCLQILSTQAIAALTKFVADGGHLLFTPFCSVTDSTTRIHRGGLPGGLVSVFGFALEDWWPVAPCIRGTLDGMLANSTWGEFAECGHATTAEVLSRFADGDLSGRPAFTRNSFGRGTAWYLAAWLDESGTDSVVREILQATNIGGCAVTPEGVEATVRTGTDGEQFHHFVNHTGNTATVSLAGLVGVDLCSNVEAREEIRLQPYGVAVIPVRRDA